MPADDHQGQFHRRDHRRHSRHGGATAAAFISYGEAKRASRDPETFGTGEIKGVAAAESGNNGVADATLIPLLALGIPGDVVQR